MCLGAVTVCWVKGYLMKVTKSRRQTEVEKGLEGRKNNKRFALKGEERLYEREGSIVSM